MFLGRRHIATKVGYNLTLIAVTESAHLISLQLVSAYHLASYYGYGLSPHADLTGTRMAIQAAVGSLALFHLGCLENSIGRGCLLVYDLISHGDESCLEV